MSVVESFVFEGVCLAVLLAFEAGHFFAGPQPQCRFANAARSSGCCVYSVKICMRSCCHRADIVFGVAGHGHICTVCKFGGTAGVAAAGAVLGGPTVPTPRRTEIHSPWRRRDS